MTLCFCTGSYAAANDFVFIAVRTPALAADSCSHDNFLDFFSFWHDCWPWPVYFLSDLDLEFSRSNMEFAISQQKMVQLPQNEWMNIYFTEVFRLVHHFTCIYTSSWISHTSDSHKSFNIDIYISFVLPAVRASFIQGLYFWFRVFKVIIPVYQYIKFFLRFSTLATGTLRSWSARHQFDACASRWCPTDANPSVPMVRAISTFSFVLKEEMKTFVGIPEVALSSWSSYICYDFYFSYWFC